MSLLKLKHPFVVLMTIVALCGMSLTLFAQDESLGSLTIGQPVISTISADTTTRYNYTLADARVVAFQAISGTAHPTIAILLGDEVFASQLNAEGTFVSSLSAFLSPDSYTIELGSANDTE